MTADIEGAGTTGLRIHVRPHPVWRPLALAVMALCGVIFPVAEILLIVTGIAGIVRSSVGQSVFFLVAGVILFLPLLFLTRLCWGSVRILQQQSYLSLSPAGLSRGPLASVPWSSIASISTTGADNNRVIQIFLTPEATRSDHQVKWFTAPLSRMDTNLPAFSQAVQQFSSGTITVSS